MAAAAPTVSVVVATYNFERFLARALDSVFAQDYPPEALEVIVVDDGSTDGTPALMEAYAGRVRYIRKENGGHLSTFNRGIAEATGDFIALLDGDDEWLPHKLREQVGLLEAHPEMGLVHGDMRVVDEHGAVLAPSFFDEAGLHDVDGDLLWRLLRGNTITTSAVLVRTALRERFHPIPDWARVQDWWIALRVAEVATIGVTDTPIADYRRHGANLNHGRDHRRRAQLLAAELPLRRWLLTGPMLDRLGAADAAEALRAFEHAADGAAAGLGVPLAELVPPDPAAAETRIGGVVTAADLDAATRHLVAALAHDRRNAVARDALERAGLQGGFAVPPAPVRIDGARTFVTVGDAAELTDHPELLAAYAATIGADDPATLVIRVGGGADELDRLQAAVAAAGLDGDDSPDLLAIAAIDHTPNTLAPAVDAVLSRVLPAGPLACRPCFDADGIGALGALVRDEVQRWCINICAPNWDVARAWGDLHFGRALQQELARRGLPCAIHTIDQWEQSRDPARFDVVLHLKGLTSYRTNRAQLNLLWNISHPEMLEDGECEASDVVLIASEHFAAEMRERVGVPVAVLEQATDPDVFFPERAAEHEHDLVFVGNSRKVMRRILADLLPTTHDLAVWGSDWEGLIDARHVAGTYLPNAIVRQAYTSAAIVLNDHWDDMREHGFASNRLYDAVACGALVVSDRIAGLEERFGGAVVTYENADDLRTIVEHFLAHPEERAARGAAGREVVLAQHTFAHRVDALIGHVEAALAASR